MKHILTGFFFLFASQILGNNRAVVNENGTIEQITHYYPFGGIFADADTNSYVQPYKYNGKELDRMHGLNWYDYGARRYDPVCNLWTSPDPLAEKYYHVSPYVYCLNNPVNAIDPDGKKVVFKSNSSKQFKENFAQAVNYLNSHKSAQLLYQLEKSENIYYIAEGERNYFGINSKTIYWNPYRGILTSKGEELSPTVLLNHEIDHALGFDKDSKSFKLRKNTKDDSYSNLEEKRVITGSEQKTAKALGEIKDDDITRTDHFGVPFNTNSPISNKSIEENVIITNF